jgi:hypothetical protein
LWDNGTIGNYWDDYTGTDANGDGVGDVPYLINGSKWSNDAGGLVNRVCGQDNKPLMAPAELTGLWPTEYAMPSTSTTPSPSVPEFPAWVILPLAVLTVEAAMLTVKRKRRPKP